MFGIIPEVTYTIFIKSIGTGFLLGALLCAYRLLRPAAFFARAFGDFIVAVICCAASFLYCLDVNFGVFRAYIAAGEIIGVLLFTAYPGAVIQYCFGILKKKSKTVCRKKKKRKKIFYE